MLRTFCWALVAFVVVGFVLERPVEAITISPRNPYRSFNISGINYASMQWEKEHRSKGYSRGYSSNRSRGMYFRRR